MRARRRCATSTRPLGQHVDLALSHCPPARSTYIADARSPTVPLVARLGPRPSSHQLERQLEAARVVAGVVASSRAASGEGSVGSGCAGAARAGSIPEPARGRRRPYSSSMYAASGRPAPRYGPVGTLCVRAPITVTVGGRDVVAAGHQHRRRCAAGSRSSAAGTRRGRPQVRPARRASGRLGQRELDVGRDAAALICRDEVLACGPRSTSPGRPSSIAAIATAAISAGDHALAPERAADVGHDHADRGPARPAEDRARAGPADGAGPVPSTRPSAGRRARRRAAISSRAVSIGTATSRGSA